jgi:hypothetical protein
MSGGTLIKQNTLRLEGFNLCKIFISTTPPTSERLQTDACRSLLDCYQQVVGGIIPALATCK